MIETIAAHGNKRLIPYQLGALRESLVLAKPRIGIFTNLVRGPVRQA